MEHCRAKGLKITYVELEGWVKISHEQFDPFRSTVIPKDFPYKELINAVIETKEHWEKVVKGSFAENECSDLTLGDSFGLEDLVCCLNITSDSCLRNRDVFAMFGRLKAMEREGAVRVRRSTLMRFLGRGQ